MAFEEGEITLQIKSTVLSDKLDDVIKFAKTKYHNKTYKDEFQ